MKLFPLEEEKNLRLFQAVFLIGTALTFIGALAVVMPVYSHTHYYPIGMSRFFFGEHRAPLPVAAGACVAFITTIFFAALGKWVKPMLAIAAICFLVFYSVFLGFDPRIPAFGRTSRLSNLVLPILILFLATPRRVLEMPLLELRNASAPRSHFQTVVLIKLTLAFFYFANGVAKLRNGFAWADGATLQTLMLDAWIKRGNELAHFIANSDFLCRALSILVLAFELLAPLIIFLPYGELIFVVSGLSFHVAVFYFLNINFIFFPFLGAYFIFFRARWLARL